MISLYGKTALVTGGGMRIGKAISIALAKEGVNVAAHYPSQIEETAGLADDIDVYKTKFWTVKADFSKADEYETLIDRTLKLTGGNLDILINNASIFYADTLEDARLDTLTRHIKINAWVPFILTRDFARLKGARQPNKGSVINILDSKIKGNDRGHTSYILSKQVLSVLTGMSALNYAPNVSVNAIAPGLILPPAGKDEAYLEAMAVQVPLKRHGGAEDIAAAALYLLKNDFMTGQVLYIDGGRHLL
jgi:NAD(P)-dependent dehydrogenase (short-subunit alcohol dehydrogenase family)